MGVQLSRLVMVVVVVKKKGLITNRPIDHDQHAFVNLYCPFSTLLVHLFLEMGMQIGVQQGHKSGKEKFRVLTSIHCPHITFS